jgi:hypothetical protein
MLAYVSIDDFYQYFIWDKEMVDLIAPERLPLVEVPEDVLSEYKEVTERMYKVQQRLKEIYRENNDSNRTT